jgi:hypothetical protein
VAGGWFAKIDGTYMHSLQMSPLFHALPFVAAQVLDIVKFDLMQSRGDRSYQSIADSLQLVLRSSTPHSEHNAAGSAVPTTDMQMRKVHDDIAVECAMVSLKGMLANAT